MAQRNHGANQALPTVIVVLMILSGLAVVGVINSIHEVPEGYVAHIIRQLQPYSRYYMLLTAFYPSHCSDMSACTGVEER